MRRIRSIAPLLLCLLVVGCAVRSANLTPGTARDLNLAFQLDQANDDYLTFFTDVGDAARAGILSNTQVAQLNVVGGFVKEALENANATWKTYQATKDESTRTRVLAFLKQATDKLAQLLQQRNTMLVRGVR